MSTHELIIKIADCLLVITFEHKQNGDESAELLLRRLQFLWNKERPVQLHTVN